MNTQIFSASFKKGSNQIYGSTNSDFNLVRKNSFAKIMGIPDLYTILSKSKNNYIYKFNKQGKALEVKSDISELIATGDEIKISYKEYSVGEFFIKGSGSGYSVGDVLELNDETCVYTVTENKPLGAVFKVERVNDSGGIEKLSVQNSGRHLFEEEIKKECKLQGGYGSGLVLEISFIYTNKISFITRTVLEVIPRNVATTIILDSDINKNISSGKLSFEKWSLTTKHPNNSTSVANRQLAITRDFTPHLNLPIIPGNNDSLEAHYNKSMSIIDQKIEKLEELIKKMSKS